jgi:hypothetical protein
VGSLGCRQQHHDGIKFFNRGDETPEIDAAAIDEAHKNKMGTVAHLSQNNVAMFNARNAGDAHLDTVTHHYGHFERAQDKTIQEPLGRLRLQQRAGSLRRHHRPHLNQTYEPGSASGSRTWNTRRRTTSPSIRRSTSTPRRAT